MFCTIRQYANCSDPAALISRVQGEIVPIIRDLPGFHSYTVVNCGDGDLASISMFDTKEQADAATQEALRIVGESLADLLPSPPMVSTGEVAIDNRR